MLSVFRSSRKRKKKKERIKNTEVRSKKTEDRIKQRYKLNKIALDLKPTKICEPDLLL
jgi:hypothetical protein